MKSSVPNGPTIPSSTNFLTNFTRLLKITESISADSFSSPNPSTPNVNTVLSEGTLSNLNDPVLDSQGATYAYLQAHGTTSLPSGPITSVQYNSTGDFAGSSSLTFNNLTNTLTANKISNGTVTIGAGTITGLTDPVSAQQAATKNYVDNYTSLTTTTVNTAGATTYSASNMINGIIYRNTQTSGTITDTLPTAAQIITASSAIVGTTLIFGLKNTSSDYTSILRFTPGTGITADTTQNIFAGYQYTCVMIVTNVGSGTEALTLYTINNAITNTDNWAIELGGSSSTVTNVRISDFYLIYNEQTDIGLDPVIRPANVSEKVNYINSAVPTIIFLDKPDAFMGVFTGSNFITVPYIWSSGGSDFYIINESTTPGADLTINGITGQVAWTLDPNSNMTIPPGYTGWFMIYLTVTNYPEISSLTSAKIFTLGIFPNT